MDGQGLKSKPGAKPAHVLVVGPGCIGTVFAVRLAAAGLAVTVLDHDAARAERIRRRGMSLRTRSGLLHVTVRATASPADAGRADLVLVCVKAHGLESAGRSLGEWIREASIARGEDGGNVSRGRPTVVTIQNGLGVEEALLRGLNAAAEYLTVVPAVTYQAASPGADGVVRQVANLETVLDGSGPLRPAADRAAAVLASAGMPARVEADLRAAVWRKLIANASINPLAALAGVANGALAERAELRARLVDLARETASVARAEGISISDTEAESVAVQAARATADNISSMRQDVAAGRPTEIEFLNGAVLRLGEKHGLALPRTREVVTHIRAMQTKR